MIRLALPVLIATAILVTPAAFAQKAAPKPTPAAAPPRPVSAEPANTSATYGDWQLRCQRIGDGDQAKRVCEVAQSIQLQGQTSPVAEIALGHTPNDPTLHLTAVFPPSVSFPSTVSFATTEPTPHVIELQWRRCVPGGCFADATPSDDQVKVWRGLSDAGRLTFKDAAARDVALPVSFRGLAQSLDALAKS